MRRAGILPKYENVSAEHLRAVVRWINGCVVVGMILAAGLGAMALAGSNSVRSDSAASTESAEYVAAEKRLERSGVLLAHEILF
jgi:hypothetical protein